MSVGFFIQTATLWRAKVKAGGIALGERFFPLAKRKGPKALVQNQSAA
jgi:hypothetical protein